MKLAKKYPKVFICLGILVLAAAGALIVRSTPGASKGGDIGNISWNVTASQLRYIGGSTQRTESYHRYLIENGPDETEVKYVLNYTIFDTDGDIVTNSDGSPKQDVTEAFGPDVPANGYGEYSDWQGVSVANLEDGVMYDITAYTRVSLYDGNDFLGDGQVDADPLRFTKVD